MVEFFCLCMSPAIDATVALPRAPRGEGEIFKDVAEEENVGGKAVNMARWLALRGEVVACGGLLGEDNARPFERELAAYGIEDRFVRVPGSSRRNEMITWSGGSMKLNRPAFPNLDPSLVSGVLEALLPSCRTGESHETTTAGAPSPPQSRARCPHPQAARMAALPAGAPSPQLQPCRAMTHRADTDVRRVAILSGSLPGSVPVGFYAESVRRLKAAGFIVVLDASGEAMRLGLEAGPDLVKPNAEECGPLVGFVPKTRDDFFRATDILRRNAAHALISDGASGAWFDGVFAPAPRVEVVDTTAAGDTLLAEFCHRYWSGDQSDASAREALAWAVAAGSAACAMPGGAPPEVAWVENLRVWGCESVQDRKWFHGRI